MLMSWILIACLCSAQAETTTATAKKPPSSTRPARKLQPLRKTLEQVDELLEEGDLISAQLVRERNEYPVRPTDRALREFQDEVEERFQAAVDEQELEVSSDYIWARKPAIKREWRDTVASAKRKNMYPKSGITVMRIRFEDPSREERIGVLARNVHIYVQSGGYSAYDAVADKDFLLLGAGSSGESQRSIQIRSLGHANPNLMISIPEEGVECGGELFVRALPEDAVGSLRVKVVPEEGVSAKRAVVRIGRFAPDYRGGIKVSPDGTCTINNLGEGACDLYALAGDEACCPRQKVDIEVGEVTEVTLPLYDRRRIEFECKYRIPAGEGEWEETRSAELSGKVTSFDVPGTAGSICRLTDWDGKHAGIDGMNGRIIPADAGDFEDPAVPSAEAFRAASSKEYPLEVGKVFAMRFRARNSQEGEAIVRVLSVKRATAPADSAESADER